MSALRRYSLVRLGTTASFAILLASCSWLGSVGVLETFARGDSNGWQEASLHSDFDVRPASDDIALIGVYALEDYNGSVIIDDFAVQGSCVEACRIRTDEIEALVRSPETAPTATGYLCGMCAEAEALIVIEVGPDDLRVVPYDEIEALLGPIDTAYEARLVFGPLRGVRQDGSGWEIITQQYVDCTPADITYRLWSLERDGKRSEVDTFVLPGDPNEPETCA